MQQPTAGHLRQAVSLDLERAERQLAALEEEMGGFLEVFHLEHLSSYQAIAQKRGQETLPYLVEAGLISSDLLERVEPVAMTDWLDHNGVAGEERLAEARGLYQALVEEYGEDSVVYALHTAVEALKKADWLTVKARPYYSHKYGGGNTVTSLT